LLALLRPSLSSRLAGYEGVNDAERLGPDPALRAVAGGRANDTPAAPTSELARFEAETRSTQEDRQDLMDLSGAWIDQAHPHRKLPKPIPDLDSSVSATYGHQQGSAANGPFGWTCYHPPFLVNQLGDLGRVMLRRGNRGGAKSWRRVLLPVMERDRDLDTPKSCRGDAAFAGPKLLRLREREEFRSAIRIQADAVPERTIAPLLKRPVGRPSRQPKVCDHSVRDQAGSWACDRRVVAEVGWHAGALFPRVGFIVTDGSRPFWSGSAGGGWRVPRGEVRRAGHSDPDVVPGRPRCAAWEDLGGERRRSVWCAGLRLQWGGWRQHFFGGQSLQPFLQVSNLSRWSRSRGPRGVIGERSA
jgi:hypothetical protein